MGLVLVMIAGVAFLLIAVPCAVLALVVLRKSERRGAFTAACLSALVLSVCAQYAYVATPIVQSGKVSFELFILPMFGWHMAPPLALAILTWFLPLPRRRPALQGIVVGLLFSIAALVLLSIPLGFVIPPLFGLEFQP